MYAKIPLTKITKMALVQTNGKKTVAQVKAEQGCQYVLNCTLYNFNTFKPLCPCRIDGKTITTTKDGYWCYAFNTGSDFKMIHSSDMEKYRNVFACSGNIETLLDYTTTESGNHPTMASSCYEYMFQNCTSLTQAPDLPATTLAEGCYVGMFAGCSSLTHAPALPATTLAAGCYYGMFLECTNLKLSSTQTGEYMQEYRIPTIDTGTTATDALTNMFTSTGGTFTGTPEINTTYYLSSDNMVVRETEIATLNGYVGSMIDSSKPITIAVTLSASAWDSSALTQSVIVSGVLADETAQLITPTPALASQTAYYEAGILCTGQAANSLAFTCTTVPTEDLTVYVVIQEVTQG